MGTARLTRLTLLPAIADVDLWHAGKSLAIGVANYGISDLQEIIDAGLPLPAVNQIPFHLYNAAAQLPLVAWCKSHDIVVLSYSPLGIPDWHSYPTPALPASTPLHDPVLLAITASHAPATAAQVTLAWLWALGLPCNPRTMSPAHMVENLAAISAVTLSAAEVQQLSSRPVDTCAVDPSFYECVPTADAAAPPSPFSARRTA